MLYVNTFEKESRLSFRTCCVPQLMVVKNYILYNFEVF